jgi:hypothetical protein
MVERFIPHQSYSESAVAGTHTGQPTATIRGVSGVKTAAAPQHAHVIRTLSAHGPPISPAARRSRDLQSPSGPEVRSGPGGPVAWAGGVDSEVVGPIPAPAMSGSTRASVNSIRSS